MALTVELTPNVEHTIRIERAGYEPIEDKITLAPGEEAKREYTLKPLMAKLTITTIPPGASVYIDREYKGTT